MRRDCGRWWGTCLSAVGGEVRSDECGVVVVGQLHGAFSRGCGGGGGGGGGGGAVAVHHGGVDGGGRRTHRSAASPAPRRTRRSEPKK